MTLPAVRVIMAAPAILLLVTRPAEAQTSPAAEYAKHFGALGTMSVAVARTMPAEQYAFRPDPGSMTFGELMSHIATTNYQFCAGLKDTATPALPTPSDKEAGVKFLSDSFEYCSDVIAGLSDDNETP